MQRADFSDEFEWGVTTSCYQIEGAHDVGGKGESIWDRFTSNPRNIKNGDSGNSACDHFYLYKKDIQLIKELNIPNYRFSLSWTRIFPDGIGKVNQQGIAFYNSLIDELLTNNIEPWVTLYHWDLPQILEDQGGWTNRKILDWFEEYVNTCVSTFGDRVKNWIVLNEPMVFTGAGYFLGVHAPGCKGLKNFVPAMHHAAMCNALGGRVIKKRVPEAQVGTTFSCSYLTPHRNTTKDKRAVDRMDALLNRLYIEPLLGLGYPLENLKVLRKVKHYMEDGDEEKLKFNFDFIGVQNYTREVARWAWYVPLIWAKLVNARGRKVPHTTMEWEVYPESIYHMIKKFSSYEGVKKVIVTENGTAFPDVVNEGEVNDVLRVDYLKQYIAQVKRAKEEGMNVGGYFVWTLMDNFEWAEGFHQRFGLVYTDYATKKRIIKQSGRWYSNFLTNK